MDVYSKHLCKTLTYQIVCCSP